MHEKFSKNDQEIREGLEKLIENAHNIQTELEAQIEKNKLSIAELMDQNSMHALSLKIVRNFVLGMAVFAVSTAIMLNYIKGFNIILNYFFLIFYSLFVGLIFWYLRKRYRLLYGLIELVVGITAIFIVLNSVNNSLDILNWKIEKIMSLVAGIYILVRGIDNISITRFGLKIENFLNHK